MDDPTITNRIQAAYECGVRDGRAEAMLERQRRPRHCNGNVIAFSRRAAEPTRPSPG